MTASFLPDITSSSVRMSSASTTVMFISKQVSIYLGIPCLFGGILGGLLTAVMFLSLRTFRESSCAFYLAIMSIANVGQLTTGFLTRIMITGFQIDWTQSSTFYCKFRVYCLQLCGLLSIVCYCLATFDQYLATSLHSWREQWCKIKMAHRLCAAFTIVCLLHGIPHLIYYDLVPSSATRQTNCIITNDVLAKYMAYIYQLFIVTFLPVLITIVFGCLAYRNVQQLNYRTVPVVRRELDRQLTKIVLVQVIVNVFCILPYFIMYFVSFNAAIYASQGAAYVNILTILLYYLYYANPFFVYVCTSERFRRQFIHVVFEIYFHRWQRRKMMINQVAPQT